MHDPSRRRLMTALLRRLLLVLAPAFLPSLVPLAAAQGAAPSKVPALVQARIAELRAARQAARPAQALAPRNARALGLVDVSPAGGFDLQIHALGAVGPAQEQQLRGLGATVVQTLTLSADATSTTPSALIRATVPLDQVEAVSALPWVAAVRPTTRGATDVGPILSEGVTLHRADRAQQSGLFGLGQTVGVISDGVSSLPQAIARGELPADVVVLDPGEGDEGTAMLEIIHDMAPQAKLVFQTVGDSLESYVAAFHKLAAAGATMIAEDIAFDDEPAFQQGLGAITAERMAQAGVWVSSSAGNLGARHAPPVAAIGSGRTPDDAPDAFVNCPIAPRNTVNLRGGDNTYDLRIAAGGAIMATLQWSEPRAIYPTAGQGGFTDLNLYLMSASGTECLASSTAVQANGVGDTIEQVLYENRTSGPVFAKLVVDLAGTSSAVKPPLLDLRWRTSGAQTLDPTERAGSLNPDSNYLHFATSAGAVGADVSTNPSTVALESYSAAGPVQIGVTTRCAGGKPGPCRGTPGPAMLTAAAPTWSAADGVSVSGVGGFGAGTCPATQQGDCRFYGTSAAAPSAAGVAALVREALGGDVDSPGLTNAMRKRAVKRDAAFGAGVLRAVAD